MNSSRSLIPFSRWIIRFEKDDSDFGIFSRWISGNGIFRFIDTKEVFIDRLKKSGSSDFTIETFESMWNEFIKVPNARISIATKSGYGRAYRKRLD